MKQFFTLNQKRMIRAGVANLKAFGYPSCNDENILTDTIYSRMFLSMLQENKGVSQELDKDINGIIKIIASDEP